MPNVRSHPRPSICCVDYVSHLSHASVQTNPEDTRSHCNLSADSWNLHAVHHRQPSRLMGLGPVCTGVELLRIRYRVEAVSRGAVPNSLDAALHCDGLACSNRSQAAAGSSAFVRNRLVAGGRVVLHRGSPLLRTQTSPLQSCDLARVRDGGKHLS